MRSSEGVAVSKFGWRIAALAGLVLAPGLVGDTVVQSRPLDEGRFASGEDADGPLYAAMDARTAVGLDATPTLVAELLNDPAAVERGAALGFPATQAEAAEMQLRLGLTAKSDELRVRAAQLGGGGFAGVWLDIAAGELVVAYTHALSASEQEELLRVAPDRERLRIDVVEYSAVELEKLRADVEARVVRGLGDNVQGWGTFPIENSVKVFAWRPAEAAAALADLANSGALEVLQFEGGVPQTGPVLGGYGLDRVNPYKHNDCSAGAWGWVNAYGLSWPVLVTAGHCVDALRRGGPPTYNTYGEIRDTRGDAQTMGDGTTSTATVSAQVYNYGCCQNFNIKGTVSPGALYDRVGDWVCMSGVMTGITFQTNPCAQILSTDLSCTSEGVLYQHMRASTYGSQGGDSGGTIYGIAVYTVDAYLAGFHHGLCLTGGYGTYRMYTSVSAVSAHLGVARWYTQ